MGNENKTKISWQKKQQFNWGYYTVFKKVTEGVCKKVESINV